MERDLANAGWGLLIGSTILFLVIVLAARQYGFGILLGAALGGALGLSFALKIPSNPARAGYVFAKLPKQLSPYERELQAQLIGRRRRDLTVWIIAPYLLVLAACGVWAAAGGQEVDLGGQVSFGLLSAGQTAALAWATQYLQVLRALRHDDAEHRSG